MSIDLVKEKLKQLKLEYQYVITAIEYSYSEDFSIQELIHTGETYTASKLKEQGVEPFYRVAMTISDELDTPLHAEVWLPEDGWNERILTVGNGGNGRMMAYSYMLSGVKQKFCVIHGDLGTAGDDFYDGYNNPRMWECFGRRGTHLMTEAGKAIARLVYEKPYCFAYFYGVSTGGQQGIASAQYFPDDFDGIIANQPGIGRTYLHVYFLWILRHLRRADNSVILSTEDMRRIQTIARKTLNALGDGAPGDGFLSDPAFAEAHKKQVVEAIEKTGEYTAEQLTAIQILFTGPVDAATGERIFAGVPAGASNLLFLFLDFAIDLNAEWLYPVCWGTGKSTKEFDYHSFDFDKDVDCLADLAAVVNADAADLHRFKSHGGKLIMLSGAQDDVVPAWNISTYYEHVVRNMGSLSDTQDFFRYFITPGCGHGFSAMPEGDVVLTLDDTDADQIFYIKTFFGYLRPVQLLDAIMKWVEQGEAPDHLLCTVYNDAEFSNGKMEKVRQRPVFPYPNMTVYTGGDVNRAESFSEKKGTLGITPSRADRFWRR